MILMIVLTIVLVMPTKAGGHDAMASTNMWDRVLLAYSKSNMFSLTCATPSFEEHAVHAHPYH